MLESPTHVVIGAKDVAATAAVFESLGFDTSKQTRLSANAASALYGIDRELEERTLSYADSPTGWVRVVECDKPAPRTGPYELGPSLLDFYSDDIAHSAMLMGAQGVTRSYESHYPVEGLGDVTELSTTGPHDLFFGIVAPPGPRPNRLLRDNNGGHHSEVHAFCWLQDSTDESVEFWTDRAGLHVLIDFTLETEEISRMMDLPDPLVKMRVVHLGSEDARPIRFILLAYPDKNGAALPTRPLASGLHALAFTVTDLEAEMNQLAGAEFSSIVSGAPDRGRGVAGLAPGGVAFELWERAS